MKCEVTVVKTAVIEVDLDEAREYLRREVPESLADLESREDLAGIAEVYVSFVEGNQLDLDFDREIYSVPLWEQGGEDDDAGQ